MSKEMMELGEGSEFLQGIRKLDRMMDNAYAEALAEEKRPQAINFSFDDIKDGDGSSDHRIRRMTEIISKYGEYTVRLSEDIRPKPLTEKTDYYKREAARMVLSKGFVNTWALGKAIEKVHGHINPYKFNQGCGVVHAYIRDGGLIVHGGTGLPNFSGRKN